jgi:ferritin-like protein
MSDYHEPYDLLDPEVRDIHRALVSLREEIEAIDWYGQRIAVCADAELKHVLSHARDEEIEHACMELEWLRKHIPVFDRELRKRLFKAGDPAPES